MEIIAMKLPVVMEILPGIFTDLLKVGDHSISRMEYAQGVVTFKIGNRVAAIVWIPVRGTAMFRGGDDV